MFLNLISKIDFSQILIKNGCDVLHTDKNGQTCLFWAASGGHLEMCKQLINRGCNPAAVDNKKKTASSFARANHHSHIVDYLSTFKKEK